MDCRGMNGIMGAAVNGAILGAGVAIWLVAGYLIQRFGFRNPEPNYATVIATSTGASSCRSVRIVPKPGVRFVAPNLEGFYGSGLCGRFVWIDRSNHRISVVYRGNGHPGEDEGQKRSIEASDRYGFG